MSKHNSPDSWKTRKFRQSVIDKINEALQGQKLKKSYGESIESAVYETAQNKLQYLGYAAKIILNARRMVIVQDEWLETHAKEVLSKPPPRLRRVLSPEELAKYNIEMMKLKTAIEKDVKLRKRKSTS